MPEINEVSWPRKQNRWNEFSELNMVDGVYTRTSILYCEKTGCKFGIRNSLCVRLNLVRLTFCTGIRAFASLTKMEIYVFFLSL